MVTADKLLGDVDKEKERKASIHTTPKPETILINDNPPVKGAIISPLRSQSIRKKGEKLVNEVFKPGFGLRREMKLYKSLTIKGARGGQLQK